MLCKYYILLIQHAVISAELHRNASINYRPRNRKAFTSIHTHNTDNNTKVWEMISWRNWPGKGVSTILHLSFVPSHKATMYTTAGAARPLSSDG